MANEVQAVVRGLPLESWTPVRSYPTPPSLLHDSNHMTKKMIASALGVVSLLTGFGAGQAVAPPAAAKVTSLYSFKTTALDGAAVDLDMYKGKVVLVVNVASRCGYTPQYAELETVWKEFKDKGLVVIGFHCNDFGGQVAPAIKGGRWRP